MKNDVDRIASYNAKVVPATVGLKVASMLSQMKTGFAGRIADFVNDESGIRSVLNAEGTVPTIQYPFYLNFGREIRKRRASGIDGPALDTLATELHAKYVSYGLDTDILKTVAVDVFSIVIT